jgi:hypothetical protein
MPYLSLFISRTVPIASGSLTRMITCNMTDVHCAIGSWLEPAAMSGKLLSLCEKKNGKNCLVRAPGTSKKVGRLGARLASFPARTYEAQALPFHRYTLISRLTKPGFLYRVLRRNMYRVDEKFVYSFKMRGCK